MVINTMDSGKMARKMEKVNTLGQMGINTTEIGSTIRSRDKDGSKLQEGANTLEDGIMIRSTAKVHSQWIMGRNMTDNSLMMRPQVMEFIITATGLNMKVSGRIVIGMEMENTHLQMEWCTKVFGS